jgi:hypothetical protein
MRTLFFILSILLLTQYNADGQLDRYRFGFQASPSLSWMSANDKRINSSGTNLGLRIGSIVEYYLDENYLFTGGIQLHLNHGGQLLHDVGGNLWSEADLSSPAYNDFPDGVKLRYHLQYLEFPFSFRMRTREFGFWRFYIEAPILQLNVLVRARGDIEGPGLEMSTGEEIRQEVRLLAISYGFGGGGEYSISESLSLITGIYYHRIITDMTNDNGRKNTGEAEDSKGTGGAIVFKIGVLF